MRKFNRKGDFYVYILECRDNTYYTGYTNDLEKRIAEHNNSKRGAKYLRGRTPVKLVWKKEYRLRYYAMSVECKIKQLSHKQKELLAGGIRLDKVLCKKK